MSRKNVRRVGNGYTHAVSCSYRERTGKLYRTRRENRVRTVAVERLRWQFHCWCIWEFFLRMGWDKHKKDDKGELGLSEEGFKRTEMLCICSKTYCCCDVASNKYKFSSKGLNKRVLKQGGEGPLDKHRRVLDEKILVTLTNRILCANKHTVATCQQVKKGLTFFNRNKIVENDGIRTQSLIL